MCRLVLLLLGVVTTVASTGDYLLPSDVVPQHYDLRFAFDINPETNFSFFGVADILLTVKNPTSKIILHAQDFETVNDKIGLNGPTMVAVQDVERDDTYNFLTLRLNRKLKENVNYSLTIPFYGNLQMGLDGVYISSYVNKNSNEKEYLVTTHFEAASARKGFPCFDEPLYKATFSVNIGHHKDYTAISNMPLYNTSADNALNSYWTWEVIREKFKKDQSVFVWDQFEKSVPMSTYLVAFVVSKFTKVDSSAKLSTTKFSIWARSDAIDQTAYAAIIGPKILSYFEQFFNLSFPLPKQDMIAIPDFLAGGMENWGLIIYKEITLLYDKEQTSFIVKENIAGTIAHELAHQWFGNLVTMKWWSDLWLKEGFATFVEALGVHALEPEWHANMNSAVGSSIAVLKFDSLESSHPVSVPVDDPNRISDIYDSISYSKGSVIIRMMSMFLGEDVFRKGLNRYLVKYSYRNADQDDLWAELTEVSRECGGLTRGMTVKQVMDTWTKQTGYPLLTVTRNYDDKTLNISQKRFLSLRTKAATTGSWWIPLNVLSETEVGGSPATILWLAQHEGTDKEHRFEHDSESNEWMLFNANMMALCRVNYDLRNWQMLSTVLTKGQYTSIPTLSRVQLVSDAFALAATNQLDYTTALQLASYLQRETEFNPLQIGFDALSNIEIVLKRTSDYDTFQKFVRKLITDKYNRGGGLATKKILNGRDLNSVKMQEMISKWACRVSVPGCEENAIELFQRWMDTKRPDEYNHIPLDLRNTVYCVAVSRGSVKHWQFLLERLQVTNVAAAKGAMIQALACTREVSILNKYLEWSITDGSEVRRQDSVSVVTSVMETAVGYYVAKDFIYTRARDIYTAFRGHGWMLGMIIKVLLEQFTTQHELDEFLAWQKKNAKYLEEGKVVVEQGIEKAKVNIDWVKKYSKVVVDKMRELSDIDTKQNVDVYYRRSFNKGSKKFVNALLFNLFYLVSSSFSVSD